MKSFLPHSQYTTSYAVASRGRPRGIALTMDERDRAAPSWHGRGDPSWSPIRTNLGVERRVARTRPPITHVRCAPSCIVRLTLSVNLGIGRGPRCNLPYVGANRRSLVLALSQLRLRRGIPLIEYRQGSRLT